MRTKLLKRLRRKAKRNMKVFVENDRVIIYYRDPLISSETALSRTTTITNAEKVYNVLVERFVLLSVKAMRNRIIQKQLRKSINR